MAFEIAGAVLDVLGAQHLRKGLDLARALGALPTPVGRLVGPVLAREAEWPGQAGPALVGGVDRPLEEEGELL